MVKYNMFYFGQRPIYTRTKVGAFAQREFAGKWAGIDIYDPRFLQWWDFPDHQKKVDAYNAAWRAFFLANQNIKLTQSQILREGKRIMSSFGFTINY